MHLRNARRKRGKRGKSGKAGGKRRDLEIIRQDANLFEWENHAENQFFDREHSSRKCR